MPLPPIFNTNIGAFIQRDFSLFFPLFFIGMWLTVTVLLGFLSGWYGLMKKYPDRAEMPLRRFSWQSGQIGLVSASRILTLSICPSGLRIGMLKIFNLFGQDIFIPWREVQAARTTVFFMPAIAMTFGHPPVGRLKLYGRAGVVIADTIDRIHPGTERVSVDLLESLPRNTGGAGSSILKMWALRTCFASAFFIIAPRLLDPNHQAPPMIVAVLFPAIVFGMAALVSYVVQLRGRKPGEKE